MSQDVQPSSPDLSAYTRELMSQLGLSEAAFGAVLFSQLESLGAAFAIKEIASGRYAHATPRMAGLFGLQPLELVGKTDAELLGNDVSAPMRNAEQATVALAVAHTSEHRIERDRQRREFSVTRVLLPAADGRAPFYMACVWVETTSVHQREMQLAHALVQLEQQQLASEALRRETEDSAVRDVVTGLYQGTHFEDQLRREVDLSSREHREFALVSIALDPVSGTVRSLGADARTRVLEALGSLLRSNTRAMDASCRVDELRFAVLLSGVGLATAHSRMEGLRRQCATQIVVLNGRDLGFTVSMGVASFPHTAHTQEDLVAASATALADAQRRGGNHVALASIRFDSTLPG